MKNEKKKSGTAAAEAQAPTAGETEIVEPRRMYAVGDVIQLRDQRQYLVITPGKAGILVAEIPQENAVMSQVHFWRNEFIEMMTRRRNIVGRKAS